MLNFLKLRFSSNFILNEGFVVSNMVHPESRRVAINFLGPSKFLRSSADVSGQIVLRQRLLRANGWRVACVSSVEIENCVSFDQKLRLVAGRLSECGVSVVAPSSTPLPRLGAAVVTPVKPLTEMYKMRFSFSFYFINFLSFLNQFIIFKPIYHFYHFHNFYFVSFLSFYHF